MKQMIADFIDQLDLALDQLAYNDRNFDRFSLMLIDNVMELLLYQYAKDCASQYRMMNRVDEIDLYKKLLKKATGKYFNDKIEFAVYTNFIEKEVGDVIIYLHSFRNSAYHEGLRHENILHSLDVFYFKLTCDIISKFKFSHWCVSSSDKISYRALKYLEKDTFPMKGGNASRAFVRLKDVANSFSVNLGDDLYDDLSREIEVINDFIDYLSGNSVPKTTRVEAIMDSQAWHYAFTDKGKEFADKELKNVDISVFAHVEFIKKKYKKVLRYDPYKSWNRVLDKLSKEKNEIEMLKIYSGFLSETDTLRFIIRDATQKMDMEIDLQIDIMRGK